MRIRPSSTTLVLAVILTVSCRRADRQPRSEEDKAFYSVGQALGRNVQAYSLSPSELEMVKAGLEDYVLGRPAKAPFETSTAKAQELAQARAARAAEAAKTAGDAFRAKAGKAPGAIDLPDGIIKTVLREGAGRSPGSSATVKVRFRATLIDGREFDGTRTPEPSELSLDGTIKCWSTVLPTMKVGEKSRFVCPPEVGYGEAGSPPVIPGNATVVFEVELIEVGN